MKEFIIGIFIGIAIGGIIVNALWILKAGENVSFYNPF